MNNRAIELAYKILAAIYADDWDNVDWKSQELASWARDRKRMPPLTTAPKEKI